MEMCIKTASSIIEAGQASPASIFVVLLIGVVLMGGIVTPWITGVFKVLRLAIRFLVTRVLIALVDRLIAGIVLILLACAGLTWLA